MPVIAALDGYALGGGAELAYAADIRIATPRLRIGNPETGLGIIAAAGASWRLREIVGEARAIELLLTGRAIGADEALRHRARHASCTPPTSCCRPRTRSPIGSRATTAPPRSRRSASSRAPRADAPGGRPRGAGRALREPREVPTHDRVPREEAQVTETSTGAPSDVGVLGGGRMGAGIAHAFLLAGSRVTVVERDADAAAGGRRRACSSPSRHPSPAARPTTTRRPSARASRRAPTSATSRAAGSSSRRCRRTSS